MAKAALTVVDEDYGEDIFDVEGSEGAGDLEVEDDVISVEDAAAEVAKMVSDAVDFMSSELMPEYEDAEDYFRGLSRVPKVKGRSQVTATVVRDAVRAMKPSIMRVFTQTPKICEYTPYAAGNVMAAAVADQQTMFVNQLFWNSGGYSALLDDVHDALLKKTGIMKATWCEYAELHYFSVTNATSAQVDNITAHPDVVVLESEEIAGGGLGLYNLKVSMKRDNGKIKLEYVPLFEFFVDECATSFDDFQVCGQRRSMAVGDAVKLGLDFDDLVELDDTDPELDENTGESAARRGYTPSRWKRRESKDPSMKSVLITEAYSRFDLEGSGVPQLYKWWLGGTNYDYLDHERVDEVPYTKSDIDPIPGAFFGRSIYDVLQEDQDTQTSLLRATCDNAHLANNRRLAVHETLVRMDDILDTRLGAPIRVKAPGMIQEIAVQSSVGAMLPLMQYLRQMSDNKVGVTAAAMGLDPDALQSTDKEAVQNTIQLSQGQIELIARNVAETGISPLFSKILRLSLRHMPSQQILEMGGTFVPIDTSIFDPSLQLRASVGLGTAGWEQKLAGLQQIFMQQKEIVAQFGIANPIAPMEKMFNTVVDMAAIMGIHNIGRYFTLPDQQTTAALAQQAAQASQDKGAEAQAKAMITATVQAEQIKAQSSMAEKQMDVQASQQSDALKARGDMAKMLMENDFKRDQMAQDLEVETAKIEGQNVNKLAIAREQSKIRASGDILKAIASPKPPAPTSQ